MVKSGQDGSFEIVGIDPDKPVELKARHKNAVSNGTKIVSPTDGDTFQLVLSPKYAFRVKFKIVDESGNAIPNATITNSFTYSSSTGQGSRGSTSPASQMDISGEYEAGPMHAGDRYQFEISAPSYASYISTSFKAVAGEEKDLGKIVLRSKSLVINGSVVDSAGQPVSDATVFSGNITPSESKSKTDTAGNFKLNQLLRGPAAVFVSKPGYQFSGAFLELPAEKFNSNCGETTNRLCRRKRLDRWFGFNENSWPNNMLDRLFELPDAKRAQINFLLLRYLSTLDPEAAKERLKRPANQDRTTDVRIRSALETLRLDNSDMEAIKTISQFATAQYFYQIIEKAEQIADETPDSARRLALIVKNRLVTEPMPRRMITMTRIGDLLTKVGKRSDGESLIKDAFVLAEGRDRNGQEAFYIASACERLSKHDLPRARKLLDSLKFGQGSSKERHLGNAAVELANQQPARAIELLDQAGQSELLTLSLTLDGTIERRRSN